MLQCDKCGAGITEGAKFCPQCGDPVTEADIVTTPATEQQIANVELTFGLSSSANYNKAIEICKNIPSYETTGEGKQIQNKVTLPITEVELIINLYDLIGSWKSSQMLINGHASTKKDLTYYGVGCYRNRQKAYKPDQYCFGDKDYEANIWGCKRLNMPIYEWGGGWLEYGAFDKSGNWVLDKNKIEHELQNGLNENKLCPILNAKRVLETLEKLPNTINPKKDKNWKYSTRYEEVGDDYKEVAVGIKPILKKANRYVIGGYSPTWETDETNSSGHESHVINIELQPDTKKSKKGRKKKSKSTFLFWLLIGIIFLLYLIGR